MTFAPATLRQLGAYWTAQGGVMLGIVGDAGHTAGYHLGKDRIYAPSGLGGADYSVQLERDKRGLSDAAAAIDLGKLNGSLDQLYTFSRWLVERCQAGEAGTRDVREIIYSPDGKKVQRYSGVDKLIHDGPGNGDASHVSHSHLSWFRDSEARDKVGVFSPYFEEDDMGLQWHPVDAGQGVGMVTVKAQRGLVNLRTGRVADPLHDRRQAFGRIELDEPFPPAGPGRQAGYLVTMGGDGCIALDDVVELFEPAAPPAPSDEYLVVVGGKNVGSVTLP